MTRVELATGIEHRAQYETEYSSPKWDYISRAYAAHRLVEGAPVCSPVASAAPGASTHSISGMLYFGARQLR